MQQAYTTSDIQEVLENSLWDQHWDEIEEKVIKLVGIPSWLILFKSYFSDLSMFSYNNNLYIYIYLFICKLMYMNIYTKHLYMVNTITFFI